MKKSLILILILLCNLIYAQGIDELGFGFQAYARNVDGSAVSNQTVRVRFSIYPTGNSASIEFTEEHNVQTDAYGIFVAEVGSINTGGFMGLNFAATKYSLKVEISVQGSNFIEISNKALNSVPYARASAHSASANQATTALNGVPTGTILPFAGEVIPAGFVKCDGAVYSKTDPTYAALANALNGAWGQSGNNFNVPDLRGMFLRGVDSGAGNDPNAGARTAKNGGFAGDRVGSVQLDEFKAHLHDKGTLGGTTNTTGAHTHTVAKSRVGNTSGGNGTEVIFSPGYAANSNLTTTSSSGDHSHTLNVTGSTGNAGGLETRPKNAAVIYIIKL